MSRERLAFIDWMKFVGISLIVTGHVAGRLTNHLTPPIYPKQLGVACFVFVIGYSLAREKRDTARVVANRLFEVFLFGIPIAVAFSIVTYLIAGTIARSNYLPFLFGTNVLMNDFPANPTTWYIGTYVHLLVIWALVLRHVNVRFPAVVFVAVAEVIVRSYVASKAGGFISYMLFTNWLTPLLCGQYLAQRGGSGRRLPHALLASLLVLAAASGTAWYVFVTPSIVDRTLPFMQMRFSSAEPALLTGILPLGLAWSACVTVLYTFWTLLLYRLTSGLPAPRFVEFFARNTVIVFIGHMPVYYLIQPQLDKLGLSTVAGIVTRVIICYLLLAVVSEAVRRWLSLGSLRERTMAWILPATQAARDSART